MKPDRRPRTAALLRIAQFGQAQWIFGNLYEAIVRIPERLSDQRVLTAPAEDPMNWKVVLQREAPYATTCR
jgi:hypothetical protein